MRSKDEECDALILQSEQKTLNVRLFDNWVGS